MKVLFVAAEAAPLAKVGGLGDVVGSLPGALTGLGHEVRTIVPKYGSIETGSQIIERLTVPVMGKEAPANLRVTQAVNGLPIYLLESPAYFGNGRVYDGNDLERFLFFSRAVVEILPRLDWQPEIVHCHDWHTALAVMWLKKLHYPGALIFTIHNLAYQGLFDEAFLFRAGLKEHWENYPAGAPEPPFCFMSQGILRADLVTTVSETYAEEMLTPEYGAGLDHLLRYRRQNLIGIVNGIDYQEYNPETDRYLLANYDWTSAEKRAINKLALQERLHLPRGAEIPVVGMVQRLYEQKGVDILEKAVAPLLSETGGQLVMLGSGREQYETMLRELARRYPEQMAFSTAFDNSLAHFIYGGCDIFLMPSRFEPCGLGQLIAMRYGALPVVRRTGGLVDTVPPFTPNLEEGNGFVFRDYSSESLVAAVKGAVTAFRRKLIWRRAMQRVMRLDFSWQASAVKYQSAYRRALEKSPSRIA